MSEVPYSNRHRSDRDAGVWETRIVPTARAAEKLFWNLMWFALIVCFVFSYNPFR